jgi:hypothetical protein
MVSHTARSEYESRKQVNITLPDASYEPAAMAVLAGLYLIKPWSSLLADLTPQQQVQAAVLADMWQLPTASEAAVGLLQAATDDVERLSELLEELLSLPAMPDCLLSVFEHCWHALLYMYKDLTAVPDWLLPLFERIVLDKYGDLEAVWGPEGAYLQESLLALPLQCGSCSWIVEGCDAVQTLPQNQANVVSVSLL